MKQILLTAIILILIGLTFRHCQYSFNHNLIPDELETYHESIRHSAGKIYDPSDGYYEVWVAKGLNKEKVWFFESQDIAIENVQKLATQLTDIGFRLSFQESNAFGVYDAASMPDTVFNAIHFIHSKK